MFSHCFLSVICLVFPPDNNVIPLPNAHAHNDYYHKRPLLDALDHGFRSVEADIFLHKGDLYVAHFWLEIRPKRTLENLYLQPLAKRIRDNNGKVYADDTQLLLLIDIKNKGEETYAVLHKQLEKYKDVLTRFTTKKIVKGPVLVVISGARPVDTIKKQTVRYAAVDGRISDLKGQESNKLMPLISSSWGSQFRWTGRGPMPKDERNKLETIVSTAHKQGKLVRFWATYDRPGPQRTALWDVLADVGVDLINTDDLEGLQSYLLKRRKK